LHRATAHATLPCNNIDPDGSKWTLNLKPFSDADLAYSGDNGAPSCTALPVLDGIVLPQNGTVFASVTRSNADASAQFYSLFELDLELLVSPRRRMIGASERLTSDHLSPTSCERRIVVSASVTSKSRQKPCGQLVRRHNSKFAHRLFQEIERLKALERLVREGAKVRRAYTFGKWIEKGVAR